MGFADVPWKLRQQRTKNPFKLTTRFVGYQRDAPPGMPLSLKIKLWRHGFRSWSYALYELDRNDPSHYLPDAAGLDAAYINGEFCQRVMADKLLFSLLLKDHVQTPSSLAVIDRGNLFSLGERVIVGVSSLLDYCAVTNGVILKPNKGSKGRGVHGVKVEGKNVYLNGQAVQREALERLVSTLDVYLVVPWVEQAPYAAEVFPQSTNTLRIVTMQDPGNAHEPFIPVAIHRFGVEASVPTDNASRGGVFCPVDLETGRLGRAVKLPPKTGGKLVWFDEHPDTSVRFEDVTVSRWPWVKEQLLGLVKTFPSFRHIGWDVVVTSQGLCVLEGNEKPMISFQMFHPYLKDPRVVRFFKHYGLF